jgi:hypothetical protein
MRSCVRLARSAKSSAPAERLSSWVSNLLFATAGLTAVGSARVVEVSWPSPVSVPTEAAAIPATPMTHAEGTAIVSSAERLAGIRRRERLALRAATREPWAGIGAGPASSWSSRSGASASWTAGISPVAVVAVDSPSCGACSA